MPDAPLKGARFLLFLSVDAKLYLPRYLLIFTTVI